MTPAEKRAQVEHLNEVFNTSNSVIITEYRGLTVANFTELRRKMHEVGAVYKVVKNSLALLALKGTQYSGLSDHFSGPIAIAYSEDAVSAAKAVVGFAKENEKLVLVAGAINDNIIDESRIKFLATLPSLDELRSTLVCMLNTPATRVAGVIQAPAGQIARVVSSYASKDA